MKWNDYLLGLNKILSGLAFTDSEGNVMGIEEGFDHWLSFTLPPIAYKHGIFLIGNGASASMASHFAADLGKNGLLRTYTFTDLSLITALANDTSYQNVFTEPISRYMEKSDLLIAISSSGNSPNIVNAVKTAREIGGSVVTISGMRSDNAIRQMGHLNLYVNAPTFDLAESAHAVVLHYWVELCLDRVRKEVRHKNG